MFPTSTHISDSYFLLDATGHISSRGMLWSTIVPTAHFPPMAAGRAYTSHFPVAGHTDNLLLLKFCCSWSQVWTETVEISRANEDRSLYKLWFHRSDEL